MKGGSGCGADARCDDEPAPMPARVSGLVWAVTVPLLFAEVGEAVVYATDTALLARFGTTELAAVGLADIAREIWVVPVIGLAQAAQIVIARRVGERDERSIGATFARSMLLAFAVGVLLAVTLWTLAGVVGSYLVASPEVGRALEDYLRFAALGLPFHGLNLVYSSLYVGLGRTRVLFGATAVLALTNLVLSAVLIFGALGLPRMGIGGAALGYVGAELAAFTFLTVRTLRSRAIRRLGLFGLRAPQVPRVRSLGRLSAPIALQAFIEALRWFVFLLIIEQLSTDALAWSSLVYACFTLLIIPTDAFSETVYSLVSRAIGAGSAAQIGDVVRRTARSALLVTLPFVVLAVAVPDLVLSPLTDDTRAIEGASGTLRVVALTMLLVIVAEMWLAAVFGTGDTDAALGIEVVTSGVMIATAYTAAVVLELDVRWVWLSLGVSSLFVLPLSYAWVRSGWWKRRAV
jgi:multidrug resistance protein, MATE family